MTLRPSVTDIAILRTANYWQQIQAKVESPKKTKIDKTNKTKITAAADATAVLKNYSEIDLIPTAVSTSAS